MRRLFIVLIVLYAALQPFERVLRSVADGDSIFKPYRLVAMLVGLLWAAWLATGQHRYRPDVGDKSFFAIFGYGTVMALLWHVIENNDLGFTADNLPLIVIAYFMYVIVKDMKLSEVEVERVMFAYGLGLIAAVTISFRLDPELTDRVRGFYKNPNQLGVASATCFIFWLGQFLYKPQARIWVQGLRVALAAVALAFLGFSGSRGATAAAGVGALVLLVSLFVGSTRGSNRSRVFAFVAMGAVIGVTSFEQYDQAYERTNVRSRFERAEAAESADERFDLWKSGVNVGIEHLGLGAGTAQYLSHHVESTRKLRLEKDRRDAPLGTHSDYVDLFASYGVFGLVVFLRYAFILGKRLLSSVRSRTGGSYLSPVGLAMLAASLTVSISQNSFTGAEYFLLLALVDTMSTLGARARQESTKTVVARPEPRTRLSASPVAARS